MAAPVLELDHGRTLVVEEDLVEVHAPGGEVEVRIRLTEDGPVLEMTAVRLALKAEEAIELEAPDVKVTASNEMGLHAEGDVRVTGDCIWLN